MWLNLPEGGELAAIRPGGIHFGLGGEDSQSRSELFPRENLSGPALHPLRNQGGQLRADPRGRAASRLQQEAA